MYTLLKNINNNIDVFLIFSDDNDYKQFIMKDNIIPIILPNENIVNGRKNSIVTYKKFYTLEKLKNKNKYDYFITADAEMDIISQNFNKDNILNKINNIFNNKIIYSTKKEGVRNIIETSANLFNESDRNKLSKITENYSLYYWWADLPIYKRSHLNDFFNIIKYDDINWHHFDHMIYMNYLLLYHDFYIIDMLKPLNLNIILEIFEYVFTEEQLKIFKKYNYGFSWMFYRCFEANKEFLIENGTIFLCSLDR
jgi:hypothetical protein